MAGTATGIAAAVALERLGLMGRASATHIPDEPIDAGKVIIVGGGLCGLTAGWLLAEKGKEVVVLEADEHPGGRVHSLRWPNGQVSELGWEEIWDRFLDPSAHWLVDSLGLRSQVVKYPSGGIAGFIKGKYVQHASYVQWIFSLNWADPVRDPADHERMAWDFVSREVGLLKDPWQHPNAAGRSYREFDGESFEHLVLREFNSSRSGDVNYVSNVFMKPEAGKPNAETSAAYDIGAYFYWYNGFGYHLRRGNDQIIARLVDRLPRGALRLGAKVAEVANESDGTGVVVRYEQDGLRATERGDVAIVTVPHTLVRSIIPSLPPERRQAIEALNHSRVIRLLLQFKRKFWKEDLGFDGWGLYTDLSPTWINNDSGNDNYTTGALSPYVLEPEADGLWETLRPEERERPHVRLDGSRAKRAVGAVLDDLAKFWPQVKSELVEAQVWQVPYYGPAYPPDYVSSGKYEMNQKPFGRIILGGDWVYSFGADAAISRARDIADHYIR